MSETRPCPGVTLVCLHAYPLFNSATSAPIGGMETRAALFGQALARSGRWQVCFVVTDFGQANRTQHEGILFDIYQPLHQRASANVTPRFAKRKWIPILNLDKRDLALIWQIPVVALFHFFPAWLFPVYWRRRSPDIVCCFGNNKESAESIADCKRASCKSVLCITSDSDLSLNYREDTNGKNDFGTPNWMCHYAIENADHIFVQTESQLRELKSRFGRSGEIIRNPVDIAADAPSRWPLRGERDTILWIGRSDGFNKRPLLLLELARRCPDLPFLMIMNKTHADVYDAVQANRPPNLTIVERVPHKEIWDYYRRSRVFVSTSSYEGFPNTFLQCAVAGVPVASLSVDPENILSRHGCGLLADGDIDVLARDVRALWQDAALAERHALSFHRYAFDHHSLPSQVERFEALLQKVINTPLRSPPPPGKYRLSRRFVRTPTCLLPHARH
jgi:glycosyltransferase involved in cell wall biosynthesis